MAPLADRLMKEVPDLTSFAGQNPEVNPVGHILADDAQLLPVLGLDLCRAN